MSQRFGWTLAGLPLVCEPGERPASGWWLETYADGFDLGAAEGVSAVRASLLLDGDDERIEHWGNRSMQWTTAVCGYSFADLAEGERALASVVGGPADLVLTPPEDGFATLFEVRTSSMRPVVDDLEWITGSVKYQAYQLSIKAAPWGLSTETQTESFATGAGTLTVEDDCSAATNWPGMVTDTYLSENTVALGPVAATGTSYSTWAPGVNTSGPWAHSGGNWTNRTSWACLGTIRYTDTIPAITYVYVDMAIEGSAGGLVIPGLSAGFSVSMDNTDFGAPIALQPQSNGFTRFFWRRPTGTGFTLRAVAPATEGQSATFHVDEFGTSTTLPSGSLLALNMQGSVRVRGQLQISHPTPTTNSLGEVLVYTDPTMLTHGWIPDDDSTWVSAPDGTYWLYVRPNVVSYSSGDIFSLTIGDQTCTTRTEWAGASPASNGRWFPMGPFHLGTNRSRTLGTISNLLDELELTRNGSPVSNNPARLIRESEDAALLHVRGLTVVSSVEKSRLFIDPPTFDQPRPGVFAGEAADGTDAVSMLSTVDSWAWPLLVPPVTALWVQASGTTSPQVTVVHRPAFHTFAAA